MSELDPPKTGGVPREPVRPRTPKVTITVSPYPSPAGAERPPAQDSIAEFEPVAELITRDPPGWLAEHLCRWAITVAFQRRVVWRQPLRAQMRRELQQVAEAAQTLRRAIDDTALREFLDGAGDGPITPQQGLIQRITDDIEARAVRALLSPELATPEGKTKVGRGTASPSGAISANELCAVVIVEAWKYFNERYPGPRNVKAAAAAESYWKASGLDRNSWGTDKLTAWRRYFETALSPRFEVHRHECRRHVREAAAAQAFQDAPESEGGA